MSHVGVHWQPKCEWEQTRKEEDLSSRNCLDGVRTASILLILAAILCIAGCGGAKSPSEVTSQFYLLVSKSDYEAASEHLSAEAGLMFGFAVGMAEGFGAAFGDELTDQAVRSVEIVSERISGNEAEVRYILHYTDGSSGAVDQEYLVKEDGTWKIGLGW